MKIKFNPTGTHIHKEKLLIRLDLYPDPTYKTYALQYIDVFARELTDEEKETNENRRYTEKALELQKLVPTKKQLNPFLCHFISIDLNVTQKQLYDYIEEIFDKNTLNQLDDILSVDNRKNELVSVMKDKFGDITLKIKMGDKDIKKVNNKFLNFEVVI